MKLLESFKMAFDKYPTIDSIYKFLDDSRTELGDRKFLGTVWYWYGCRGYNQFLDYGLYALKIRYICRNVHMVDEKSGQDYVYKAVTEFLFDDRHDIYQNIPYYLGPVLDKHPELAEPLAVAWIECFNMHGTEDVSHSLVILQKRD